MNLTTDHSTSQANKSANRDNADQLPSDDPPALQLAVRLSRYVRLTAVYPQDGDRCLCDDPGCDAAYWPDDAHEVTSPISDTDLDRLRELRSELAVVGVDAERRRELLWERVRLDAADSIGGSLTCDPEQLRQMWRDFPDAIPAVGFHDFSEKTFRPFFAVLDDSERLLELTDAELLSTLTDEHPRGDDIRRELEDAELERALENFDASLRATIRDEARKLVTELPGLPAAPHDAAHKTTLAWLGRFEKAERTVAMDELFAALEERERSENVRNDTEEQHVENDEQPDTSSRHISPATWARRSRGTAKYTDLWNAKRMVGLHGDFFRYCPSIGWLDWTGAHWRKHVGKDVPNKVVQMATDTVLELLREANSMQAPPEPPNLKQLDETERNKLAAEAVSFAKEQGRARAHAIKSHSEPAITRMLKLAKNEPFITIQFEELDAIPLLVNCQNGTVSLVTQELREHQQGDHITNLAGAPYHPDARCSTWERFLDDLTDGDVELAHFLQRAFGYALAGNPVEEKLFLLIGPPDTGKTTLLEAVRAAAGTYAATASAATFTEARRTDPGSASPDVARLATKRVVTCSETKRQAKLAEQAEATLKLITGGDAVTARHLYRAPFEFVPSFSIFLASNFDLKITGDDDALWKRVIRIPCEHHVVKPNTAVKERLRRSPSSLAAILAWMVAGYRYYTEQGLNPPKAVGDSVRQFRMSMDSFTSFVERCCRQGEGCFTATSELRDEYVLHHRGNGFDGSPITAEAFGKRLGRVHGLSNGKKGGNRGWHGIELLPPEERPEDDQ